MLHALAEELDVDLGPAHLEAARAELDRLGVTKARPRHAASADRGAPIGSARAAGVLATWHELLDAGRMSGRRRAPGRHGQAGAGADLRDHGRRAVGVADGDNC